MPKLDEVDMARKELIDLARTVIRLKHRSAANRELNDVEPVLLAEFNKRVARGQSFQPSPKDILALIEGP